MSDYRIQFNGLELAPGSLSLHNNELQGLSMDKNGNFPTQNDFLGVGPDYDILSYDFFKSSAMEDGSSTMSNMQLTDSGMTFDPNFGMDFGSINNISSAPCTSRIHETSQAAFPDRTFEFLPLAAQNDSAYSTPELLDSPNCSVHSFSLTPGYDAVPPAWFMAPQSSLAGPSTGAYAGITFDMTGLPSDLSVPFVPFGNPYMSSATDSLSLPPPSASRPKKKTRSSTAKAISTGSKPSKPSVHLRVPCTVQGCSDIFYNVQTRNRHIRTTHERAPGAGFVCPGMCREGGFSREDALNRHLITRDSDSICRIEAAKLGWSASVRLSVKLLRGLTPEA